MNCTIIISILDSHEVFRRQMLHFSRIMPANFELIIMDDGSETPLRFDGQVDFPFELIATKDRRLWTSHIARTRASKVAQGDYLLMTDIDHILTREALEAVAEFDGDLIRFRRRGGSLDEQGRIVDRQEMLKPHLNTFGIRKDLFARSGYPRQPGYGDDRVFRRRYQKLVAAKQAKDAVIGPEVYVIRDPHWFPDLPRVPVF